MDKLLNHHNAVDITIYTAQYNINVDKNGVIYFKKMIFYFYFFTNKR